MAAFVRSAPTAGTATTTQVECRGLPRPFAERRRQPSRLQSATTASAGRTLRHTGENHPSSLLLDLDDLPRLAINEDGMAFDVDIPVTRARNVAQPNVGGDGAADLRLVAEPDRDRPMGRPILTDRIREAQRRRRADRRDRGGRGRIDLAG